MTVRYQPQQSVLNPHAGHRQTACMRNISAPHRSQQIASRFGAPASGVAGDAARAGEALPGAEDRVADSDIGQDYTGTRYNEMS